MAGISDQAALKPENYFKYNGKELNHKEFSDGSGLDWYSYGMREYDPQIARFFRVDPLSTKFTYLTPYQYASNNPILNVDLDGLEGLSFELGVMNWSAEQVAENPNSGTSEVIGAAVGVGTSIQNTVGGFLHPVNSIEGAASLSSPRGIANTAISVEGKINTLKNGTGFEKAKLISQTATTVATAIVGPKVLGEVVGGISDAGKVVDATKISDDATVVRGGLNTPEAIAKGTGTHPSGVTGVSVECGNCSVEELAKPLPHSKIGVTTVGDVRNAGGDVIRTSGASPNHATMTGLPPERASELLNPVIKNPNKP
jgi:RHS repeat-associated protein